MDSLCAANTAFALNLLRKLCENRNGQNLFFSPFSISSALSMVLSLKKAEDAHNGYQSLLSEINDPNTKYILRTANRLYGEKTFEFLSRRLTSCCAWEDSRKQINSWVEEMNEGKIRNLLAAGILNSLTRLVLVNAIYFKGNWAKQFDKERTEEVPFQINKEETRPCAMMCRKAMFNMAYIWDLQTKILELPLCCNELSMIIVLILHIELQELTYEKLIDWLSPQAMECREVMVSLPRFKLEENYDLKPFLRSMGMLDAFDIGKADFSGISAGSELVLSEVVHKSFVEVNEEGTEAAAATAGVMMMRCIIPSFSSSAQQTSTILFCGRFCSP
uniref:Serpin domain-containing protein n=1 Tax=Melopsittacus undulatus TaxID=13146 RepID=A0A8V5GK93_MELUD